MSRQMEWVKKRDMGEVKREKITVPMFCCLTGIIVYDLRRVS